MKRPMQSRDLLVSDAGPLIALAKCGQLGLLVKLFDVIHVPQAVVNEVLKGGHWPEMPTLFQFLNHQTEIHADQETPLVQELRGDLHEGESQAIALASVLPAMLLIDELQGRYVAQQQGAQIVGTMGILLQAKRAGLILRVQPSIEHIRNHGYALSNALVAQVLRLAGEG